MFLSDSHMHSSCSYDAEDTMLDMAFASDELGVSNLCFTDHCDLDNYVTGKFNADYSAHFPRVIEQYEHLKRESPAVIRKTLGIELGSANHYPDIAREISSRPEFDFVIASVHNLRDTPDFYCLKYSSEEECRSLIEKYLDEYIELSTMDCFDVLGHIGYTLRYMLRAGYNMPVDTETCGDQLRVIFKNLIHNGRGIELNCSGMRHPGIQTSIPLPSVLKLYREMGGEIITVGSDAHRVAEAGRNIKDGFELLRELGYKYTAFYKNRSPEFHEL